MAEELNVTVWRGKYVTLLIKSYEHVPVPDCELHIKYEDFCKLITWAVSYSAYDHNIKLRATRVWFGLKDGTVVHMWTNIDRFPLSLWCYEYYDLEVVKRTIHERVWYDRHDNGLNLTPATVAGDVPPEIMEEVEWHWHERVEQVPLSEVC